MNREGSKIPQAVGQSPTTPRLAWRAGGSEAPCLWRPLSAGAVGRQRQFNCRCPYSIPGGHRGAERPEASRSLRWTRLRGRVTTAHPTRERQPVPQELFARPSPGYRTRAPVGRVCTDSRQAEIADAIPARCERRGTTSLRQSGVARRQRGVFDATGRRREAPSTAGLPRCERWRRPGRRTPGRSRRRSGTSAGSLERALPSRARTAAERQPYRYRARSPGNGSQLRSRAPREGGDDPTAARRAGRDRGGLRDRRRGRLPLHPAVPGRRRSAS